MTDRRDGDPATMKFSLDFQSAVRWLELLSENAPMPGHIVKILKAMRHLTHKKVELSIRIVSDKEPPR